MGNGVTFGNGIRPTIDRSIDVKIARCTHRIPLVFQIRSKASSAPLYCQENGGSKLSRPF